MPTASNLQLAFVAPDSVLVTWDTDVDCDSAVSWNVVDGPPSGIVRDSNYVQAHSVTVPGLILETNYAFQAFGSDTRGNPANELDGTLETPDRPPEVLGVKVFLT